MVPGKPYIMLFVDTCASYLCRPDAVCIVTVLTLTLMLNLLLPCSRSL